MTHGHKLRVGHCWKEGGYWVAVGEREKNWDNCNHNQ